VGAASENSENRLGSGHPLKVSELASEWRVSRMTVYRLVREGKLKATWVGRSIRLRREDVEEYLELGRLQAREDDLDTNGE
jgi:excisionase family DNA binding protein